MTPKADIQRFIKQFKDNKRVWNIVFRDDRGKNSTALAELEITPNTRIAIIDTIELEDYSEGPVEEILHGTCEMWVFGKFVKSKEVYIKLSLYSNNGPVLCISFHVAEHPMSYPYKSNIL